MDKFIEKLFNVEKIPFKIVLWISICTGVVLFSPSWFISKLHIQIEKQYISYIGIIFLASASLAAINIFYWIFKSISNKLKQNALIFKKGKIAIEELFNLDEDEKSILREFYIMGKKSINIPLHNPAVANLTNKGIIETISNRGIMTPVGPVYPCSMTQITNEHIDPKMMIDLPNWDECSSQERQWIIANRPKFVKRLDYFQNLMAV